MTSILTPSVPRGNIRKQTLSQIAERIADDGQRTVSHVRVGAPPRPKLVPLARRADIDDGLMGVALLAGPANVIMQLAGRASDTA